MKLSQITQIKNILKKKKKINILIPEIIDSNKSLSKEIKTRIKLHRLLSDFDIKATNKLNFFIKESNRRRLDSKSGIRVDKILLSSKHRSYKEAYKIINDYVYINKDINTERLNMQKKTTQDLQQNLLEKIYKLKGTRPKIKKVNSKNEKKTESSTQIYNKIKKRKSKLNTIEIEKVLNEDVCRIKESIEEYKNIIKQIKVSDKNDFYELTPYDLYTEKKKIKINFPNIKLLNFKKYLPPIKIITPEKDKNKRNKKKLMQYSKSVNNLINYHGQKKVEENFEKNDINVEGNLNGIILKNAIKVFDSEKIYENKNQEIDKSLKINEIPNIKVYENIIAKKFKKEKSNINKYINDYVKYLKMTELEKTNAIIYRQLNKINEYESKHLFKKI